MNDQDWEAARGVACGKCKTEALRLQDGLCPACAAKAEILTAEQVEDKAERAYYRDKLRRGTVSLKELRERRPERDRAG